MINNSKPLVGVFTPTFNRAHLLSRCYKSLCAQTSFNFEWYIIDDGSTDNTKSLVDSWEPSNFKISYIYKKNGGLHTGYNVAIDIIDNPLCVCIDSDDCMPPNAIKLVEKLWKSIDTNKYAGIMGLDCYFDGSVIGDPFPKDISSMYLYEKLIKYKVTGDKKMVYRTDLLKSVAPMPSFDGEKHFNPSYLMYKVDKFAPLYVINECLCLVEYQPNGMSSNIWTQYYHSPKSFAETRRLYLSFPHTSLWFKLRHTIHYCSSSFLAKNPRYIMESPRKLLTLLCTPPGILLAFLISIKGRG